MIDQAAVGPAGRTVRCARCKATWFAGTAKPAADVSAFVDSVIAEAQAEPDSSAGNRSLAPPPRSAANLEPGPADEFGNDRDEPMAEPEISAPPVRPFHRDAEPDADEPAPEPFPIADAPPLVPPMGHAPLPEGINTEIDSEDIESFAARRQRLQVRRKVKRRSSRWTAVILLLIAFNVAVIGARNEVVRYLPQTASLFSAIGLPVNLRHLQFEDVKITKDVQDGATILVVQGAIVSTGNSPTEVPRLRFSVRNVSGQEIYTWTALPSRSILEPGARLDFHSRLASPPAEATDVLVRFFNAQDAAAGVK
jgi:hypothetical protein